MSIEEEGSKSSLSLNELKLDLARIQCKNLLSNKQKLPSFDLYKPDVFKMLQKTKDQTFKRAFPTGYGLLRKDGNNSKIHFWFHSDPISHKPIQPNRTNEYSNYYSFNITQTISTNDRIFIGNNIFDYNDPSVASVLSDWSYSRHKWVKKIIRVLFIIQLFHLQL